MAVDRSHTSQKQKLHSETVTKMDATGDSAPRKIQEDMGERSGDGVEDGRPKLVGS